ncbi:MAG: class GN sortase [Gammaproteobacteria bacterium]|nr:MAG: class GN sortase [Gammaproteobacteria bacterium]
MKFGAHLRQLAMIATLGFTIWHWAGAATIRAKAYLAPILIARAWDESRAHQVDVKPWPWADTWPVARLHVPALNIDQYVLAGANGAALPFGPGHLTGTALPGEPGGVVIAGHSDTHFYFLHDLPIGTKIVLERRDNGRLTYEVTDKTIVDTRVENLLIEPDHPLLLLVTCEPDSIFSARGPYRLVVTALPAIERPQQEPAAFVEAG